MSIRLVSPALILFLLISACSSGPIRDMGLDKLSPRKAEKELSAGLKSYENGQYQAAAKYLQNALDSGLTFKRDRVTAHKYLAFVYCVSDRKKQCRAEFKEALEINSDFELSSAEAGHPLWGPVYREVKAEQRQKKK